MIRGVVLNQHCAAATITTGKLFQECTVGGGIEDGVLGIVKAGMPQVDGAEDLDVLSLPSDGNLRRTTDAAPCRMESRILSEAGFVREN